MKIRALLLLVASLGCLAVSAAVEISQTVSLVTGWNAVHLGVAPSERADLLFATWPVSWVAVYDSAAFLETAQFSGSGSTEGVSPRGYRMWRRDDAGATEVAAVPGDSVLVCFASEAWTGTVYGRPCAPRITWHKCADGQPLNIIGFSTYDAVTTDGYFSGLDVGDSVFYVFGGNDATKPYVMMETLAGLKTFKDGDVLAVNVSKKSDWSGALNVSPRDGVSFGQDTTTARLEIRNDGATGRTVSLAMSAGSNARVTDIPPVPLGLWVRDQATAVTNGPWQVFAVGTDFRRYLESGETLVLQFAVDRGAYDGVAAGTYYGAVLTVRDEDGGSKMRVNVPVEVASDGGAQSASAWPKGIWIASAELDTVTFFRGGKDASDVPAGGAMKVRLPLTVDGSGQATLLQRLWYGRDERGVLHAYSGEIGSAEVPLTGIRRISTPFLPTDRPTIHAANGMFDDGLLAFDFVVDEKSNVNPMRHARHPMHDGLSADFKSDAPSGDALQNYIGEVKPETFSITNRITFAWSQAEGARSWSPDETVSGDLVWEFSGVRHEGTLRARGRFTMRRISSAAVKLQN